jgi:hypothetical protein
MSNEKIVIDKKNFSKDVWNKLIGLIEDKYVSFQTGKSKSDLLEQRMRSAINESKPETTDYDFPHGEKHFFVNDKVELKQFDTTGSSPKLQQVKPRLYNKILVAAEFPEKTEWWVITTDKISSVAGKENKELGKLTLQKQHKGNELEGQITFTQQFKKMATKISETGPLNYSKKNLGVSDEEILQILEKVKKH